MKDIFRELDILNWYIREMIEEIELFENYFPDMIEDVYNNLLELKYQEELNSGRDSLNIMVITLEFKKLFNVALNELRNKRNELKLKKEIRSKILKLIGSLSNLNINELKQILKLFNNNITFNEENITIFLNTDDNYIINPLLKDISIDTIDFIKYYINLKYNNNYIPIEDAYNLYINLENNLGNNLGNNLTITP